MSLIPLPMRLAFGAAVLAAASGGLLWFGHTRYEAGAQDQRGKQAVVDAKRAEFARVETDKRRADDARTAKMLQEAQDAEHEAKVRQRADKVIADAASGDLRRRYEQRLRELVGAVHATATARGAGSGDPPATSSGAADEDVAGMLADVYGQCLSQRQRYAEIADDARTAGQLCERAYDALIAVDSPR